MRITIVGAGNMGLALTAYLSLKNKGDIVLFSKKNILANGPLRMNDVERSEFGETTDFSVTDDPELAFSEADIILVTYPAFLRKAFIEKYQDFINKGTYLGFLPGYGGIEYSCVDLINKGVTVFGFQRVPYVARASKDGEVWTAGILSKKQKLYIGAIPHFKTKEVSEIVNALLDIPVQPLKEYLAITLAPSNPLLHITGLYNVFHDYHNGTYYSEPLHFYEEWNDDTSKILFQYDEELQKICEALSPMDLSEVVPLPLYYESPTPEAMTRKLKSIPSFNAVMVPLIKEKSGYVPDLESRMFIEDYPYGVCIIKDFALITGVSTPTIDMMLDFYTRLSGHIYFDENGGYTREIETTGIPGIYGIHSTDDVFKFYHK